MRLVSWLRVVFGFIMLIAGSHCDYPYYYSDYPYYYNDTYDGVFNYRKSAEICAGILEKCYDMRFVHCIITCIANLFLRLAP